MEDVARLRWTYRGADVTCENCHTALYKPASGQTMCPTCLHALGEDLMEIHARMAGAAAERARAKGQR